MISDSIPTELMMEILSRLPTKSIARFHCVSKQWESLFGHPYFRELFLTRSFSDQPRILFVIEKDGLWSIFSVPQRLRPYEKPSSSSSSSSLVVSAEFHMNFPPDNMWIGPRSDGRFSFGYASGLMYFHGLRIKEQNHYRLPVICNPKTGRYTTFASYLFRSWCSDAHSFFGFDPIEKKFKVLSMEYPRRHHAILTLETGKSRRIKRSLKHENVRDGICVNGVLYYLAETCEDEDENEDEDEDEDEGKKFVIVCFDVRSEEFKLLYPEGFCQLINYKGKLGVIHYDYDDDAMKLLVWVLEDFEKQKWSKYEYTLRDDKFLPYHVSIVGVNATGEIILSMGDFTSEQPFYVFYFNPERNTLQRVEIKGFGEYHEALDKPSRVHVFVDDCSRLYAFADQVEDLYVNDRKFLESSIYVPYVNTEEEQYWNDYSGDEYDSQTSDEDEAEDGEEYDFDYEYEYEDEAAYDYSIC
ncbi:unnamed protein product [Microthlaspi erraticum]|uniref:F-box domain-containing protein n=1 Tax=Microthlaspi erraticum TaxID=1685480 RepID=A0A6D2KFD1_9BRAS|nr:unnamed protein product [Microthlaspi erraticum]